MPMRFCVVVAILFAAGCATSPTEPIRPTSSVPPPEPTPGVRVTGHLLAFTTNAGVPGATVIFDPSEGIAMGTKVVPSPAATRAVTDGNGFYNVVLPADGRYWTWVDDDLIGMNYVAGSGYRGDLFVGAGTTCVARYGTITDAATNKPVSGATVTITLSPPTATSGLDGWYRIDLGCPADGKIGFNTTFLSVKHPSYPDFSRVVGRGVAGLMRLDVQLQPR